MRKQRTAVVGLGITGMSCVRHLHTRDELLVIDTRDDPPGREMLAREFPKVATAFGARASNAVDYSGIDRVIVSPGVGLEHCVLRSARALGLPLLSDIDLFCSEVAPGIPIFAITGTNGKSTVTALVGHLLNSAGRHAGVGGNLGVAALDLLRPACDAYVLELSSFQLERMVPQTFAAATILNVTADHLDRHGDMNSYVAAKQVIYARADVAVSNRADPRTRSLRAHGVTLSFGLDAPSAGNYGIRKAQGESWFAKGTHPIAPTRVFAQGGTHNQANALAALAMLDDMDLNAATVNQALSTFIPLPHRCQIVRQLAGVTFVNDSKATNVGACIAALDGLADPNSRRIILLVGGDGKGADFTELAPAVAAHAKLAVVFGWAADALERALTGATDLLRAENLAGALSVAHGRARDGDCVLLSPACASFDEFANFAARGDWFVAAVGALA